MGEVSFDARRANRKAKRATTNHAYHLLARAGYVARGVLYAYMGYAALRIALTALPQRADQQAGLLAVAGFPLGRLILTAGAVALAAYALWGFIRAIYDPLHRGDDPVGIVTRLGFAWSGLVYSTLLIFTLGLLTRASRPGQGDAVQQLASRVLGAPFGAWLLVGAGLIGVAAGVGQFVEAWRASFKKDEKRGEMSESEKRVTDLLGRAGFISRGVVFTLMGWFIFLSGTRHDASRATGYTGTFTYLLTQPYGRFLLALVAVGFVALGLHSLVLARYIRMPSSSA